ncbi:MAG TPA: DNA topoisomerase IV subunit A [Planctomycetota bacterium]|nr:DNA topoisomerase IV subunit A [Planctomycetota bacterium]
MASKKSGIVKRRSEKEVSGLLDGIANVVIEAAKKGIDPKFDIPVRSLNNVAFNKKKRFIEMGDSTTELHFFNMGMAKKFMQTILVADALMELQREDATTSLREVFYRNKHTIAGLSENTFDKQKESDPIIEDIEVTLALLREELHVRAGDTGQLIGPLTIVEGGDTIDCARQGIGGKAVPSIVEPGYLDIKSCTADFVLLIEKGTQFNRLSEDKFWKKHNCILLTGGGQPPRGVRRLARRLHEEWKLPVLVLVDNDPWGYYIYSVVKQGSINLAFESQRMAIPDAKFIGLSSRDPEAYGLPRDVGIVLEDSDVERAKQLLNYDWFQKKEWQSEIEYMLKSNLKYELDALAKKNFRYLTTDYLPKKLKDRDWLD